MPARSRFPVALPFTVACACSPTLPTPATTSAPRAAPTQGREAPALIQKSEAQPELDQPARAPVTWSWVLPVDHGIRRDDGGEGGFLAPRAHGSHNGLDLLAPIGTVIRAPCAGKARAGKNPSHGKWVHLACPLPGELGLGPTAAASLFFAHLSATEWADDAWHEVGRGETVGRVGKSGNASGSQIAPHLHLEIAIHDDEPAALADTHSGRDQTDTEAARAFVAALEQRCFTPSGLTRQVGGPFRARRVDPFLVLTCLGDDKPAWTRAPGAIAAASYPWTTEYRAATFDVDRGRGAPAQK